MESFEKEVQSAQELKQDLENGVGWNIALEGPGYMYWIKTFPEGDVPIKILYQVDLPFPVKALTEMLDPRNHEQRRHWDKAFLDHKILESHENGGHTVYMRAPTAWPLTDRSFVLFVSPWKEVTWFDKQALLLVQYQADHASKPAGEDGCVRAANGGNFFVATLDESNPDTACKLFGLTTNQYNGCVPNYEFLLKRVVPKKFNLLFEDMKEGYEKYYKNKDTNSDN